MTKSSSTKIQIRSTALRAITNLKSLLPAISVSDIEKVVWEFSTMADKEFLAEILLKEIDGSDSDFDNVLATILVNVTGDAAEEYIWKFLSEESISDTKKLFLINLLREIGSKVNFEDMANVIEDSDNLMDMETQKFLEMAKMNPEAQIDFLDFFFGVSEYDKTLLLKSIAEDFGGDELASILLPIIYCDKYSESAKSCMEALKKTKSYLPFSTLEWVIRTSKDSSLANYARKILNEIKISGLRENFSQLETYKKLLHGSIPHSFWVCTVDGTSNFPCVFARERKNGTIQTFFTVINIEEGPCACFGFNEVAKDEFDIILQRFFKNSEATQIPVEIGVKILNESIEKTLEEDKKLPYELLCWRQITLDIEPDARNLEDIFKENLNNIHLGEYELRRVLKGNIVDTWFYKYGDNDDYDALIDEIISVKIPTISKIEELILKYKDKIFEGTIDKRLLYHAYFTACSGLTNIANILYSLIQPSKYRDEFLKTMLKKSIYEYFLSLREPKSTSGGKTFFELRQEKKNKDIDVDYFVDLIEREWIK